MKTCSNTGLFLAMRTAAGGLDVATKGLLYSPLLSPPSMNPAAMSAVRAVTSFQRLATAHCIVPQWQGGAPDRAALPNCLVKGLNHGNAD